MEKTPEERFNDEYGGSEWEPAGDYGSTIFAFDDPGKAFYGTYRKTKHDVGKHESQLHIFESEGETYGIWGTYQLDEIMEDVNPNDQVAILYVGKKPNPKTGMSFKSFAVKVKRSSEPLPSAVDENAPF